MLTCGKTSKDEAIKLPHQKKKQNWGVWLPIERYCCNLGEIIWLIVPGGGKKKGIHNEEKKRKID